VLGRLRNGTSTFLRVLTNQRREFTSIEGDLQYSEVLFELAEGGYRGEILFLPYLSLFIFPAFFFFSSLTR